jgi:polyisoprenoid-binding protein YceI
MPRYTFEPGHTAAEFQVRHMMVTWVRGHFKDIHGSMEFDPTQPSPLAIEAAIDAQKIWSGEPQRDNHLRSPDFLDTAKHPTITFKSTDCQCASPSDFKVSGVLTIRGISRPVDLDMHYVGQWKTPYWTDAGDAGPITRVGFVAKARINRQDFQVSWNSQLENGGAVVGDDVVIRIDVEALLETDIKRITRK